MHIGRKILRDVESALRFEYNVYLPDHVWEVFKRPLTFKNGELDVQQFENRQEKATQIVEEILTYHGKGDIVLFLERLAKIESNVQELQPWVRDHVVHAVNTFLLGVYILRQISFPSHVKSRYDPSFMWKLTGPTHDLGYPYEIGRNIENLLTEGLNDIIGEINVPSPRITDDAYPENLGALCNDESGHSLIQDRLTEWALGIDVHEYYGWLKRKNRTDHGVIGALAQLKVLDAVYQKHNPDRRKENEVVGYLNFNEENFRLDIVSASAALFIHNIDLNYYGFSHRINFRIAPLAFLLFLCDTFQEWDRYSKHREVFPGEEFDIDCYDDSIHLTVPKQLEDKIYAALHQRLTGLMVEVNGRLAVHRNL